MYEKRLFKQTACKPRIYVAELNVGYRRATLALVL